MKINTKLFKNLGGFSLLLVFSLFFSCANPPDYPIEPVIEFQYLTKYSLIQNQNRFADGLDMVFSYTDGDGDLGDKDSVQIFITDARDGTQKEGYKIPFVDEAGAGNGISGEITIKLNTSCCIYPDNLPPCKVFPQYPTDTLVYRVQIRDRAGHFSNVIETPIIVLYCQ